MSRAKTQPVVCGRRICNGPCGRWRPITDFGHKAERRAPNGRYIIGRCEACVRTYSKSWYRRNSTAHIENVRRWKEDNPDLVAIYRQEERARRKTPAARARERAYQKARRQDPVMGPQIREYYRVYRNMKRHELGEGHPEKVKGSRSEHSYNFLERDTVDSKPFVDWLNKYYTDGNLAPLAETMGIDESFLRRLVKGEYQARNGKTYKLSRITIGFVDRALFAAKRETTLWDLYPHLYK